jgi:uncharacterized protein (DUF3084 family)
VNDSEAIVIEGQVIGRAWVRTAQEQLTAARAEKEAAMIEEQEARRRRDAWKARAAAATEQIEALQLAVRTLSSERDRALRQLEVTEHLGVELQRRVLDLEAALARASSPGCAQGGQP